MTLQRPRLPGILLVVLVVMGVASALLSLGAPVSSAAPVPRGVIPAGDLYQEGFSGTALSGSWLVGGNGTGPCLTAGSLRAAVIRGCRRNRDQSGHGVLRLTNNRLNQSGFVLYNHALDARQGLNISFDMYQYNSTTPGPGGADGISFILIDGASSPHQPGIPGYALGYRGLDGGYLAVGFDEWGNFSDGSLWQSGMRGRRPDSIVVRGAESDGYPYILGRHATRPFAADRSRNRAAARRHVVIEISTSGQMTVSIVYPGRVVRDVKNLALDSTPGQPPLPPTVKFGFAASTGAQTAIHEVSNLVIRPLPPVLAVRLTPQGKYQAGGTGRLIADVSSDPSGGPVTRPVAAVISVPASLTLLSAEGDGWSCTVSSPQAVCTRPDPLPAGGHYPSILLAVSLPAQAPSRVLMTAQATTAHAAGSSSADSSVRVPVSPVPGPDLSMALTPVPGAAGYRMTVSNAPGAGKVTGPVDETFTLPAAMTPVSAHGAGWACQVANQQVTCARDDGLLPGGQYPAVDVSVRAHAGLTSPVAEVGTPGDTGRLKEISTIMTAAGAKAAAAAPVRVSFSGTASLGGR